MSDSTPSDSMTLAGLALANGPWLGVRLQRLAEHAGHPLTEETVESAVSGSSRVLAQVLDAEGRPSANADHATDPAAQLGREQALLHQQARLDMPASLKVLRLMRRAYDDLVRESWVDKDSRSRAHEDVERFFERMLVGHCLAWAGNPAPPQPAPGAAEADRLAALVAQREVEAAHQLALTEIDNARAEAETARKELRQIRQQAREAVDKAESQTLLARREAEIAQAQAQADVNQAREELRKARETHATLASEAEAMRTRLAETGSRMTAARRAEEAETQARLAQAQQRVQSLEAEVEEAGRKVQTLSERLAEQEGLHAFKDERLREQSRAVAETQELLVSLGAAKKELQAQAQAAGAERDRLDAELAALTAASQAGRAELATELDALRQQLAAAESTRDASQKNAQALEAERDSLAARLIEKGNALAEAERQGQDATTARNACASLLSTHLALTGEAVAAVDGRGNIVAWNPRFPELFGLAEADQASPLETLLPLLARRLQRPEAFLARLRKLMADPTDREDGLTLATSTGQTLVFRSHPTTHPEDNAEGAGGRLLNFRDMSLEHDMENLVREIEAITRDELGHSLTAFIHLPQELLDDPATTPAQTKKLTVIRDSGYRIVNTVNMAVDIFRMERGLYKMSPGRSLDLAVVARRAAKDVSQLAASRHIDLKLLLDGSPLPQDATLPGPGDPIPAHTLVLNLLRDALEAAPRQSSVQATLHLDKKAKLLCLDITRPGALNPDELARFFDKPVGKDPGNGLARARYAAKLIANTFGGTLNASTSPESTTLSLRLPKA